jgi:hypothetical protein
LPERFLALLRRREPALLAGPPGTMTAMPNYEGTRRGKLVAFHPGGQPNLRHGLYAVRREITPEVRELADELMALSHVVETDYAAALEVAKLMILIDRVDAALGDGRVEHRGRLRALVDQRRRLSARLERWYTVFGLSPRSRWELGALARPSFQEAVRERLRAANGEEQGGHAD